MENQTQAEPTPKVIPRRQGLELRLRPRRVTIEPRSKRQEYIERIEKVIEKLEEIINSEDADESVRIRAANALARLISTSYIMVVDAEIEKIEEEAEKIKRRMDELHKKRLQ